MVDRLALLGDGTSREVRSSPIQQSALLADTQLFGVPQQTHLPTC